jgi:HD-like signal output (HDOD) protein
MGKIIFDSLYTDFYAEVLSHVKIGHISIYHAEESTIGLNHCQIGRELCEAWQLPPDLIEAVAHHHHPTCSATDTEIASLIHISNFLAHKLQLGSGGDTLIPEPQSGALLRLQIKIETLQNWEPEIREAFDRDKAILSILKR